MGYIEITVSGIAAMSLWLAFQIRRFIPAYINKKAEDLASKEDLGQITEIVESVRTQHAKELEMLSSQLDLMRDDLKSVRSEGRTAATKFFEDAAVLALDKLIVPAEDIGYHTGLSVSDYRREVTSKLTDLVTGHAWLLTYFHEDDEVLQAADEVVSLAKRVRIQINSSIGTLIIVENKNNKRASEEKRATQPITKKDIITSLKEEKGAVVEYRHATGKAISEFVEAFNRYSAKLSTFLYKRISE